MMELRDLPSINAKMLRGFKHEQSSRCHIQVIFNITLSAYWILESGGGGMQLHGVVPKSLSSYKALFLSRTHLRNIEPWAKGNAQI